MLQAKFEGCGARTIVADSTKFATTEIERNPSIDLVVANRVVGNKSGIEILTYIRSTERLQWLPLIMMSDKWDGDSVQECMQAGATHIIALPLDEKTCKAKIEQALASGKRTILVVDDEEPIREILKEVFELERHRVLTADSVDAALQLLETETVSAVVSDIVMGGLTGMDLLNRIKAEKPALPVIMITGYSGKYTPDDALAAGADGYFHKPFHNTELAQTIKRILKKQTRSNQVLESGDTSRLQTKPAAAQGPIERNKPATVESEGFNPR